jgi:hypothetical protein
LSPTPRCVPLILVPYNTSSGNDRCMIKWGTLKIKCQIWKKTLGAKGKFFAGSVVAVRHSFVRHSSEMRLDFYEIQLIVLASACLCCLLLDKCTSSRKPSKPLSFLENGGISSPKAFATLARDYLVAYAIVMGECTLFRPFSLFISIDLSF